MNLVPDGDGPTSRLLAELPGAGVGLYAVEDDPPTSSAARPVPDRLANLIDSARRYPPALALAREEIAEVFAEEPPTVEAFARSYATAIEHHLTRQPDAPYLLGKALRDASAGLSAGQWYWLLQAGSGRVVWVSDDFEIYESPAADFDLTATQLKGLA